MKELRGTRWWSGAVIAVPLSFAVVVIVVSRALWLPLVGRFLVVSDPLQLADAIVPLAGGFDRIPHGAKLLAEGYADWFVVTNTPLRMPGIRSSYGELAQQEAIWQGVPEDRIIGIPGEVETTYEEALAMRQLLEAHELRSLIVVTDPYHTRRSRMVFRAVFRGSGVTLIVRPVDESWYQTSEWWHMRDGLLATWTEYLKLVLYVVGYR